MAWSTPKTNWTSGEFFTYADYNRITENIDYLYAYCNTNVGYIGTPYTFTTKTASDYLYDTGYNEVHDALRYLYENTGAHFTHDALVDKDEYAMPWSSAELNNIENMCLEFKAYFENFTVEWPVVVGNTIMFPASWASVSGNTVTIADTYGVSIEDNKLIIPERSYLVDTASGAIANFDTSLALPLQDCTIVINAVQESGTPTPSSPKLISGFTGANIKVAGSNLWDEDWKVQGTYIWSKNYIPVKPNTSYYRKSSYNIYPRFYDNSFTEIGTGVWGKDNTITTPSNTSYLKFMVDPAYGTTYNNDISINYPATDTAYHAYNANSTTTAITWQDEAGTVYGGSLDVTSGKLTVTHARVDLGSLTQWNKNTSFTNTLFVANVSDKKTNNSNCICTNYTNGGIATGGTFLNNMQNNNFASDTSNGIYIRDDSKASLSGDDFKTAMSGVFLAYELATPVTYQLTPTQISAIVGTNNVFTDTNGDTSVVYACSLKDYIDSQ